jgi:hypothetical protein
MRAVLLDGSLNGDPVPSSIRKMIAEELRRREWGSVAPFEGNGSLCYTVAQDTGGTVR